MKHNIDVPLAKVSTMLDKLSKKYFTKSEKVFLYDVRTLKDGTLYPIYTSQPYRDFHWVETHRGFPTVCNPRYASWIIDLYKTLKGR